MNVQLMLQSFFAHPPVDAIIIVVMFLVVLIDALRRGYARAASIAFSLPIAAFLFGLMSHAVFAGSIAGSLSTPVMQAALFIALSILVFLMVVRIVGFTGGIPTPFLSIIAALATTAAILATWEYVPALQNIWHFGPFIAQWFGEMYSFWWFVISYIALAFVMS